MQCNVLMIASVGSLFKKGIEFGWLRSSGMRGLDAFEELVPLHRVAMYIGITPPTTRHQFKLKKRATSTTPSRHHAILRSGSDKILHAPLREAGPSRHASTRNTGEGGVSLVSTNSRLINDGMEGCRLYVSFTALIHYSLDIVINFENPSHAPILASCCDYPALKSMTVVGGHGVQKFVSRVIMSSTGGERQQLLEDISFDDSFSSSETTELDSQIFEGYQKLRRIDISCFVNVTRIGNTFLDRCISLESIDLSPFTQVTEVGSNFLCVCAGLKQLDLSPMVRLESVGAFFLGHRSHYNRSIAASSP